MSLTRLEEDLAVHQKLSDEPNDVGGLSAQELKAKFDQAGLVIQRYLNEVHLPQAEAALEKALEEAKAYADGRAVAMGAGDMAAAIYDPKGVRRDVYRYAHDEAEKVLGGAARFGYVAQGKAEGVSAKGETAYAVLVGGVDPRGLWDGAQGCFVIPQGGQYFGLTAQLRWARESFAGCTVRLLVNGEAAQELTGPDNSTGSYVHETVLLGAKVQGGDRVRLELATQTPKGCEAEVGVRWLRGEILL